MTENHQTHRRSLRRFTIIAAAAAVLALAVAGNASATFGFYQASISPATAAAGASTTATLTIKSGSIVPLLGSVNVSVPAGWTNVVAANVRTFKANGQPVNKGWTVAVVGNTIQLRATASLLSRLLYSESVKVDVTGKAACTAGQSEWTTAARGTNTFTGYAFTLKGTQPTTSVSGSCADHLAFIAQPPASSDVGQTFSVTVQVQDAQNQPVTTPTSVSLTIGTPDPSGGTATLTGGAAQTVTGSGTFNLAIDKPQYGYTLLASAPSLPHPTVTSASFDILFSQVTQTFTAGTAGSAQSCTQATSITLACATINLGNGANGPLSLTTGAPVSGAPAGSTTTTSAIGDLKDPTTHAPLYTATDPAHIVLTIDSSLFTDTFVDDDYHATHPVVTLYAQLSDSAAWNQVPWCSEPEGIEFDAVPDGDESFPPGQQVCLQASHVDESGDGILYVQFYDDFRLSTR